MCLFLYQSVEDTDNTGDGMEPAEASKGMCWFDCGVALLHLTPVVERARENALIGDKKKAAPGFGSLKDVLGAIPAIYANHEVRQ